MNIPNQLTVLRILLIPVFLILFLIPFNWGTFTVLESTITVAHLIATIVFVVASITDWLDGYLARKHNLVTNFGKFADPLADKLLVMAAFIALVGADIIPSWAVVLIVSRELAITGLRLLLAEGGEVNAANMLGKIKTFTQLVAIPLLMLSNFPFAATGIRVDLIIFYVCVFFTVLSGINYFYQNRHVFSDGFK